jgi:twitching motility protein PilT
MDISELLSFAVNNGASDLHLSSNMPPIIRINGVMTPLRVARLAAEEVKNLLISVMSDDQLARYETELDLDFAIDFGHDTRYRVNAFHTLHGPAAVLRAIPNDIKTLEDLKCPPVFKKLAGLQKGIVLVTGPTGSGKSTTLAAMVSYINMTMGKHIITIEDPIEFIHKSNKSLINHRELGTHTKTFSQALKSSLREDPDVILIGELRDLETIRLALTAAETGHLVLSTLHTSSAAKTIDRIIDVFPPADKNVVRTMLSGSLEGIIAQKLIPTKDKKGRVAAHEILIATPAIRNLIRDNKIPQIDSSLQTGSSVGMQSMKDCVHKLFNNGIIDEDSVKAIINSNKLEEESKDNNLSTLNHNMGGKSLPATGDNEF